MRVDLHLHSTASDGSLSPSALAWAARAGGLDVIALTDHDTIAGVPEAMGALPDALEVIPGVELSTTIASHEIHILGYFIDPQNAALLAHGKHAAEARATRVKRMIELLANHHIKISYDDVLAAADGSTKLLGRPHVARALHRKGYVQTPSEAFDRFLGDGGPCFLPTDLLAPAEAIRMIKQAGGVALWAHPRPDLLETMLPQMIGWGLEGVECFRPRATPSEVDWLRQLAAANSLIVSGGSDWHGSWQGRLGDFFVLGSDVRALLAARGVKTDYCER